MYTNNEEYVHFKVSVADEPKMTIDVCGANNKGDMEAGNLKKGTMQNAIVPIEPIDGSGINFGCRTTNQNPNGNPKEGVPNGNPNGTVLNGVVPNGYPNGTVLNGVVPNGYPNGTVLNGVFPSGYPNGTVLNGVVPSGYPDGAQERMQEKYFSYILRELSRQQEYVRKMDYDFKKEERKCRQKYEAEYAAGRILERDDGSLSYIIDIHGKKIHEIPVLNCAAYKATLLVCNFPRKIKVLEITVVMKTEEQTKFHVMESQNGFSSKTFAKEFAKAGLKITVAKKKAAEVHSCLLEYSLEIAEKKNVFLSYGWWKTEDGSWHFIKKISDILWGINHV